MSDALEQAAAAFDVALGNTGPQQRDNSSSNDRPVESMFDNLGDLEVDDESPARGGGDDDEPPVRRKQQPAKMQEENDDPDLDGEGQDYEDPDDNADDDADEGDGEGDEGEDGEEDDFYKVTVDGQEVEVPLREALDGYIRQETFHRRMNELDEVKKAIRNEAVGVLETRKKYVGMIDEMQRHLDALIPQEPNWVEEYKRNPEEAAALQERYNQMKQARSALKEEQDRVSREQLEEEERQTKEYIDTENKKILAMNPSWRNGDVMKRDLALMMDTATRLGFTEEEVRNTYDSRMVAVLLKAAKYDRLQQNKPKPVRRGKRPMKPGAGSTRTAPKGSQAMKQLSRTGSVEDAAGVFLGMIQPPRRRK